MAHGRRERFHYGWVIVGTGTLTVLACLGFGRFALGMLLPSMAAGLSLSYAQIGWVGTGNFVGYLAAVLACGPIAGRIGARRLVALALLLVGASMVLVGRAGGFATLLPLYVLTGFGSGAANVPVMGLVARWFHSAARGRAAGFVAIGSGVGIVLSGRLIPWVNRVRGADGWRASWAVLGAAVIAIAVVAAALLRDGPEAKGLAPYGAGGGGPARRPVRDAGAPAPRRAVALLALVYALFGATYATYVTFIVTVLVRERGFSERVAGDFWSAVGLLSLLSGPVFGALSDRLGRRAGLAVVLALQGLAYALAAADGPQAFLYLSIGLFGVAAWSVPTIMLAAVGDYVGPSRALSTFGRVTFAFALGQIAGPSMGGVLAERTGSFRSTFWLAAALAALAILAARLLRPGHAERAGAAGPAELAGDS